MYTKAPFFSSVDDQGHNISLNDFKGKTLLLFFYPMDFTPHCSIEAWGFKEMYDDFLKKNIEIVGVSKDKIAIHQKFKKLFNLPFRLISDTTTEVCNAYDVYKERNIFGKKLKIIERSTFIINPQGEIIKEWRRIRLSKHFKDIKQVIEQL